MPQCWVKFTPCVFAISLAVLTKPKTRRHKNNGMKSNIKYI